MGIFLALLYAFLFCILIYRLRFFYDLFPSRNWVVFLFLLKIAAGFLFKWIYEKHYHGVGDTFLFFNGAGQIHTLLYTHPADYFRIISGIGTDIPRLNNFLASVIGWDNNNFDFVYNESRTVIRLNALLMPLSSGYYEVHIVFFNMLSFTGLTGIYRMFRKSLFHTFNLPALPVFLIPSVLFWGSGVLKDALLYFSLGLMLFFFSSMVERGFSIRQFILFLLSSLLLSITKLYILILLIPGLAGWLLVLQKGKLPLPLKFSGVIFVFLLLSAIIGYLFPEINPPYLLYHKQHNYLIAAQYYQAGSQITVRELTPDWFSVLSGIPSALYNSFFQPSLNSKSILSMAAWLENLVLVVAVLFTLFINGIKKIPRNPVYYFSLYFALSILILAGLTTPVTGSLVRYKAPSLIFLFYALLSMWNKNLLPAIPEWFYRLFKKSNKEFTESNRS